MDKIWLFSLILGVLALGLSLFADSLGLGDPGFDAAQAGGAIIGGGLILAGIIARRIRARKAAEGKPTPPA